MIVLPAMPPEQTASWIGVLDDARAALLRPANAAPAAPGPFLVGCSAIPAAGRRWSRSARDRGAGQITAGDRRPQRVAVTALSAAAGGPIRSGGYGCRPASRS